MYYIGVMNGSKFLVEEDSFCFALPTCPVSETDPMGLTPRCLVFTTFVYWDPWWQPLPDCDVRIYKLACVTCIQVLYMSMCNLFRLDHGRPKKTIEFALKLRRTLKPSNDSSLDPSIPYETLAQLKTFIL